MEPLSRDKPVNPCRDWFLVLLLFAELLLVTATWRLWFAADVFPVIPLFQHCGIVPAYIDPVLSVIFVISVAVWMWTLLFPVFAVSRCGRCSAYASWIALSCALALACLNQHRLQPWHWLFILVTAQPITSPELSPK